MKTYLLYLILTFIFITSANGQELPPDPAKCIKIEVHRQLKGHVRSGPIQAYFYDLTEAIQRIKGGVLNPVVKQDGVSYIADYIYDDGGKLNKEDLYETHADEAKLKRVTKYHYDEDCIEVETMDTEHQDIVYEVEYCHYPQKDELIKTVKLSRVFTYPNYVQPTKSVWKYDLNQVPTSVHIQKIGSGETAEITHSFQYDGNRTMVESTQLRNDQLYKVSQKYLSFNEDGSLKIISFGDSKNSSSVKIKYHQNGLIKEILTRGTFAETGKRTWRKLTLNVEITSLVDQEHNIQKEAIKRINEEIIKMYFPTVRGPYGNSGHFDDSRRFIQNQG